MPQPSVFLSYRREDTAGHAGRLFDRAASRLGRDSVFRDLDHIGAGEPFAEVIRDRVNRSSVMLVLIGPRWEGPTDSTGRSRLWQADDFVRIEVSLALGRGIRTIPVLVAGGQLPPATRLPPDLQSLAGHNAFELRDAHFDRDAAALLDQIAPGRRPSSPWLLAALLLLLVLAAGVYAYRRLAPTPESAHGQLREMRIPYDAPAFITAARRGDFELVKLFLFAGMKPDESFPNVEDTAINAASAAGHLPIVRLLAERGASTRLALGYAAAAEKSDVVDYLLGRKPSAESAAFALDHAAAKGRFAMLNKLLDSASA